MHPPYLRYQDSVPPFLLKYFIIQYIELYLLSNDSHTYRFRYASSPLGGSLSAPAPSYAKRGVTGMA